ncbi:restriction endonuclease subunit S [Streptomyces wuyuanensis]|uniref:restriction endonuclease subunit S n=1 Tax=Streptomyces wuyuanensis TaxID=1196353 RepID=UPI0037162C6E
MSNQRRSFIFQELIRQEALEIGDGYRAKNSELGGNGPVFMRAGRLTARGWDWGDAERFHASLESKVAGKMSRPGDTVITTKGNSTGRTGYVNAGSPSFVYSPHLSYWRSRDSNVIDNRYLRYWALSPELTDQLKSLAHGTDMAPYLSLTDQKRLTITLPKISDQRVIAGVLGALDDKIAVNDRIAATALELSGVKFRLLSRSTEEEVAVRDVIELKYGKSLPAARRISGAVPVFGSGGISGFHNEHLVKGPGIIIGRKGTVGAIYWSEVDFFPIDTTFYVACKSSKTSLEYMYFALKGLGLEHMNSDSAVPGLNRERAQSLPIRIPALGSMQAFTVEVRKLFQLQRSRAEENQSLTVLRDTLLPQLMSGRLRVKDAEKIVEDNT